VSGRGRRASLPAGGHARPEYLIADGQGGLVVRHHNREGRVREYDFASLPVAGPMQASLAALFATRCTPDRWSVHATSRGAWIYLQQFAEFVDRQQRPPRDLDELTPGLVQLWRESLAKGGAAAFGVVSGLLRDDARLQEGRVADELARRYRAPRSTVQSYSEAEFNRITAAARRQFRAALRRISENAVHLQRWQEGAFTEGSADWVIGEGLDILARTGDLPKYTEKSGKRTVVTGKYRKAFGGMSAAATWQRLFLSRMDAVALGVLLVAEYGWNLSVIDRAEVPRAAPDQGEDGHPTYRIPLEKPRRGAGHRRGRRRPRPQGGPDRPDTEPARSRGRRDSHRGLLQLPRQPLPVAGRRLRRVVPDVPGLPERTSPSRPPPRLAHLHEALASLRSVLPPAAWAADWRDAHDRLDDLRQRLGDGPWAQALARVTDADRELVSHLLTGVLSA
jgi:hypothetical protein